MSAVQRFAKVVNAKEGLALKSYWDLHKWSTGNLNAFWTHVWDFTGVIGEKDDLLFDATSTPMDTPNPRAIRARVNFAENMLLSHPHARSKSHVALVGVAEPSHPQATRTVSYEQLYDDVRCVSNALRARKVGQGDTVAAFAPNNAEMVEAMLGAAAVGSVWSSCATEFGVQAVLDRLTQISPKVLFTADAYVYNGKTFAVFPKLQELLKDLPSVETVVVVGQLEEDREPRAAFPPMEQRGGKTWLTWGQFLKEGAAGEMVFNRMSAMAPLYVLYSSGTTGKPKAIIHSAGGMLLHSKMSNVLHGNATENDCHLQFSTLAWMMWNHTVSHLGQGATVICYDGSPLVTGSTLWDLVDQYGVTSLGVSPRYLASLEACGHVPKLSMIKSRLNTIITTGSPMKAELYSWVWENVGKEIFIHNLSGGSDICGIFVGGCQDLPFNAPEIQVPVLGMDVQAWGDDGEPSTDGTGQMVITKPFPNMPLGFWGDIGDKRYHEAYFEAFGHQRVWAQGDYVAINPLTGGISMLGRSDGVLNPSGIRIGSSEIYDAVAELKDVIEDCLVVGQKLPDGDERVVLFVKSPAHAPLDDGAMTKIRTRIRQKLSARHVPAVILPCPKVPYTTNGKRLEVICKKLINGVPFSRVSTASAEDPTCLEYFVDLPELRLSTPASTLPMPRAML